MLLLCSTSTSWSRLLSSMKIWSSSSGVTTCLTLECSECRIRRESVGRRASRRHCFAHIHDLAPHAAHHDTRGIPNTVHAPEGEHVRQVALATYLYYYVCGHDSEIYEITTKKFQIYSNFTILKPNSTQQIPLRPSPKLSHYGLSLRQTQPPHKAAAALL